MSDLRKVLKELGEEGMLDSSGSFTVDLVRSREQLFKDRLVDPAAYVLKLIQGFVRLRCTSIRCYVRGPSTLEIFAACPALSEADLREALVADPLQMADSALKDLALGLGCVLAFGKEIGLAFRGPQPWTLLTHPRVKAKTRGSGLVLLIDSAVPLARLAGLIKHRCVFCPVPLFWNDSQMQLETFPWLTSPIFYECIVQAEPDQPHFNFRPAEMARVWKGRKFGPLFPVAKVYLRHLIDPSGQAGYFNLFQRKEADCQSVTVIPLQPRGTSWLLPVRHGVLLDRVPLSHHFGCHVVLCADRVPVDLGQFRLREGDEFELLCYRARVRMIQAAARSLICFEAVPVPEKARKKQAWSGLAYGMVGVTVALTGGPLVGVGLLLRGLLQGKRPTWQEQKVYEELARTLHSLDCWIPEGH